jgi:tetratricopeptide (TPR) repeat protein
MSKTRKVVLRIYFSLAALCLVGVPAANGANTDPDIAACDNLKDLDARVAGCTRLLARKNLPAKSQAILYLQRAQGYVRLQQFDRALQDYDASLKRDPNLAIALGERAIVYNQMGDPDHALQSADQAIRLDPIYILAYAARGNALSQKGQFDQAIDALNKSIGLDPKQQWLYISRSTVWNAKGETDRAVADLDTAIKLDPNQAVPYNNRCWVWTAKGELDNALADCNRALELDANFAVAYSNRGVVWFQKGELDSALSDFNKAIRIDPSYWAGFTGRGDVWRKKGELERALADFQQAIRISPRAARSFVSEGLVFEAQGQVDRARSAYEQAVALPASISVIGATGPVTESFRREQDTARTRLAALRDSAAVPSGPLYPKIAPGASGATVAPASATLGRRIALVIGNGAYAHAPHLVNPANDARVIARNLRDMGFEVSDGIDLDRAAMTGLIADFLRAAATANTTVLFYAGHGVQIDGENFLLPIDVKFNGFNDLTSEMTNVSTILAGLDDSIRANIVFLDACRDNPFSQKVALPTDPSRAVRVATGLASPSSLGKGATTGAGTLLAFSTAPGQIALDGDGANSPFSLSLARHLGTTGLEVQQMLTRVRAEVVSVTHGKQVPWSNSSLLGEVYLAGKP